MANGSFAGFQSVKLNRPKRSAFDLTHDVRLSMRMGVLTPVLIQECIPADSFRGSSEILLRLAPLLAPIYDQVQLYVHYFFVPNRLLWDEWEPFITGGRLGVGIDPLNAPVPPFFDIGVLMAGQPSLLGKSQLLDYLGVPLLENIDPTPANWNGLTLDAMPALAYQLVWYEYYRDRNFVADDVYDFPFASGDIGNVAAIEAILPMRKRAYMHDYFTSALPFTQRGEEVLMPVQLGGTAPLYFEPLGVETTNALESVGVEAYGIISEVGGPNPPLPAGSSLYVRGEDFDGTSTSINDFRSAYALQVWLERNAIGGSRYTESTQAHFGVKPQDSRLQRPEYIGGGLMPVRISEVVSTAWSDAGGADPVPLANMAGHGMAYGNTNQFNYFCFEHGFIIGIASIMNPPSYQLGLSRMWRRRSFLDYPWPTFSKLGEQEVSNYEIYTDPASLTEDTDGNVPLFGYQSRYADWKYNISRNAADFRDTLEFWTLTRLFQTPPVLSQTFVEFDTTTEEKIFAVVNAGDNFWLYCHNKVTVKRALPYFGTPNNLGFE